MITTIRLSEKEVAEALKYWLLATRKIEVIGVSFSYDPHTGNQSDPGAGLSAHIKIQELA